MRRLITIPISHYCERARWALDRAGVDYVEERHLQVFHARPVRRATAGRSTTVPVLIEGDRVFADSADIVARADEIGERRLYPEGAARDEVEGLERELAGELGVEARRLAYSWFLDLPKVLLPYNNAGAPRHQRLILRLGFRLARRAVERYYEITPETAARAADRIDRQLDAIAGRIEDGGYLCGDAFTAADLTFAALLGPVILPPGYGPGLPDPDELPDRIRERCERYRAHPAGAFALELYRQHRH